MGSSHLNVFSFFFFFILVTSGPNLSESARVFTIINNCKDTVWPGITPGDYFDGGGFSLIPGQSKIFTAPLSWTGRIWGRTGCSFNKSGQGKCQTGNCGPSLKCSASAKPPATLAEFTLATLDFYDVSLVDGFNIPMSIKPIHGKGNCSTASCDSDLRVNCPSKLAVKASGKTVACRSACQVFNTDKYCCRGKYGNPFTCHPTHYSKKFKSACPTSFTYPYDDPASIFTCSSTDYVITFCSTRCIFVSQGPKECVCSITKKLVRSGAQGVVQKWWILVVLLFALTSSWFIL
ncbi:hypothetical protein ACHQM5_008381 [Ranunculus cassubicifolius]